MNALSNVSRPPVYAIFRIEGIKSLPEVNRRFAHNDRSNLSENVDPNGPAPQSLLPDMQGTPSDRVLRVLSDRGIDIADCKEKIIAAEMFMSASKAFWVSATEQEKADWIASSLRFVQEKFGSGLIEVMLHADEEVPHIHAIGVPVIERPKLKRGAPPRDPTARAKWEEEKKTAPLVWTLSYDAMFGGSRDNLSALQDEYHASVEHLGLARGERKRAYVKIDLGDEIEIDGPRYSRGKNADGTDRARKNIPPKEYREILVRKDEKATVDAQEAERSRLAAERLFSEAADKTQEAEEAKRAAQEALHEAEQTRLTAEANARRQQELSNFARAQAERLLDEARAEKQLAKEEVAVLKAEMKKERDQLADDREQDNIRLGLLERSVDDQNGLKLRSEGDAFAMDEEQMSAPEREAYRKPWPVALFEIARKLAEVLATIRGLWKKISDGEKQAVERERSLTEKEMHLDQRSFDLDNRDRVLRLREYAAGAAERLFENRSLEVQKTEASLDERKAAIDCATTEVERRQGELARASVSLNQQAEASERWAAVLSALMTGEYHIVADESGQLTRLVSDHAASPVTPILEATFATERPTWVNAALGSFALLAQQAEDFGQKEDRLTAYEERLCGLIESAGPVLSREQAIEVDRIQAAISAKPTAQEVAARSAGGGRSV